jgi:hypothetical protein
MFIEHNSNRLRPTNWRINPFCESFGMGRTKFYELVAAGKLRLSKCGNTSLITDTEAQRFQAAMEAGEI